MASHPYFRFALVALIALCAVMFGPQARASTFTASTFSLTITPDVSTTPPGFVVTEGSGGSCFAGECDSLDFSISVTYTGTGTPNFDTAAFGTVVSGDPLDKPASVEFILSSTGAPTSMNVFTIADFNGDSGLNQVVFTLTDRNALNSSATVRFDMTIVDPTPIPAALPLFATGIGGLGLLGWRRKRKARAIA